MATSSKEPDPNDLDPNLSHSFTDGDSPPPNATKKTVNVQAIQMNMGFDCNGTPGNPGDWAVCLDGRWYVMSEL